MPDTHIAAKSSGLLYALGDLKPQIDPTAWIAPTAVLIGDVRVGPGANIWFNCVLRADTNPIIVGARSNIQDGTVTIGHAAIIHACRIETRAFIGMGATVLDGAVVEEAGLLAARGFLGPGKRIGKQELWMGSPAKLARVMSDEERAGWDETVPHYLGLAARFRDTLKPIG
jgi:carbonic anhydrase/acetyltransferase-like protein (isoleucine patch superfamily)